MNPPSSDQVQYGHHRVHVIAAEKMALAHSGAPTNTLAEDSLLALKNSPRRPTVLPRHILLRNIVAAIAAGKTAMDLNTVVRVPHSVTLLHRRWAEGEEQRNDAVRQVQEKCRTLVDGLHLGTIAPADAIAQMQAFEPTAPAPKAKRPVAAKKAKAATAKSEEGVGEGDAGAVTEAAPAPKAKKPAAAKKAEATTATATTTKKPAKDLL